MLLNAAHELLASYRAEGREPPIGAGSVESITIDLAAFVRQPQSRGLRQHLGSVEALLDDCQGAVVSGCRLPSSVKIHHVGHLLDCRLLTAVVT